MKDEYEKPINKKCLSCYWYEYKNVYSDDKGKCTLKYFKCERLKEK